MAKKNQLSTKVLYRKLDKLYEQSPTLDIHSKKKWVIFSDLHMGDGGSTDDFKQNANLFTSALKSYYLKGDHALILNGDVEELQRFQLKKIVNSWKEVYRLFDQFNFKYSLFKTVGNHDLELQLMRNLPFNYKLYDSLRLRFGNDNLFVFHGHQASKKYQEHNELIGFTLKYFANPLGIKSYFCIS
ncbi:metallophosphoesterase [Ekhidna sp.]|uniref:metallophosphoesterase n=1 Tax=Ekhidna sp. TaxID=2608089 RepID=UPI003BAA7C5E